MLYNNLSSNALDVYLFKFTSPNPPSQDMKQICPQHGWSYYGHAELVHAIELACTTLKLNLNTKKYFFTIFMPLMERYIFSD